MAQKKARRLEITPLSSPIAPINSPLSQATTAAAIEYPSSPDTPPAYSSRELRAMLTQKSKLREIALLTELLQPPLSRRPNRRMR
jgi:hypothetical protein